MAGRLFKGFLDVYVQVEAVSEFAQYWLERAWFETYGDYLVVVGEYDKVDLLVLYGDVCEGSALVFDLR